MSSNNVDASKGPDTAPTTTAPAQQEPSTIRPATNSRDATASIKPIATTQQKPPAQPSVSITKPAAAAAAQPATTTAPSALPPRPDKQQTKPPKLETPSVAQASPTPPAIVPVPVPPSTIPTTKPAPPPTTTTAAAGPLIKTFARPATASQTPPSQVPRVKPPHSVIPAPVALPSAPTTPAARPGQTTSAISTTATTSTTTTTMVPPPPTSTTLPAVPPPLPPRAAATTITKTTAVAAAMPSAIKKPITALAPTSVPSAAASSIIPPKPSSSKPKKKKTQPTVTMATAPSATQGGPGSQGENTGRWTAEEHRLFLQGLEQHGKGWKKIASLIKSRTVVQIRTHAQKYFQKLAKARQNGEEGDVAMEGRGGLTSVTVPLLVSSGVGGGGPGGVGGPLHGAAKRRRALSGTKRKALTSVVQSAQREGKRLAAASGNPPSLPAVAPPLAPFIVPGPPPAATLTADSQVPTAVPPHGSISGPALEDSLFRFLTPAPISPATEQQQQQQAVQVSDVARQAGANPITLPSDSSSGGDTVASPTGVTDVGIFPSWTDAKDMPSWYAKGADVDSLLDVADTLNWLSDTGDLHETYEPPPTQPPVTTSSTTTITSTSPEDSMIKPPSVSELSIPNGDSGVVPPLPSLFESSGTDPKKSKLDGDIDEHLNVFDTPMEEHAFVSALLDNTGESSGSLPVLQ